MSLTRMKPNFYISIGFLGLCLLFTSGCLPSSKFAQTAAQPIVSNNFSVDYSFPESGSTNSFNAFLRGSAPINIKRIRFFNGPTCAAEIGSGFSSEFRGAIGIPITFPQGTVTTYNISAKVIYTTNKESDCLENIFEYKRTGTNIVTFLSATPASPSNVSVLNSLPPLYQPLFKGTSSSNDIAFVRLYKNSDNCTQNPITPVGATDAKISRSTLIAGVKIDLDPDAITAIYAKGYLADDYQGKEADSCHLFTSYNVDITPPNFPATITHRYFFPFKTSPSVTWTVSTDIGDEASGLKNYKYGIGFTDSPEDVGVVNWTETTSTSFMLNREFEEGKSYFVKVRAVDKAGNQSDIKVSHGWTVRTLNTPILAIKSPDADNTIVANFITIGGTCVYGIENGITNKIRFQVSGGMKPIPDAECAINNQFSTIAQAIPSVGNVRSVTATQNDGEKDTSSSRILIYSPLSSFGQSLAAGNQHTCTTKEGTLYCWGENDQRQLGVGDINGPLYLPLRASHSNLNKPSYFFEQIGNGDYHSCALSTDRLAYCWGDNRFWQLGNSLNFATEPLANPEEPNDSPVPVKVNMSQVEGGTFKEISVGSEHTCALSDTGKVYCWGRQNMGQIGNRPPLPASATPDAPASQVERPTLISIPGTINQISAGHSHSCALTSAGDIWCWGNNSHSQLGNPTKIPKAGVPASLFSRDPVIVVPSGQVDAGEKFKYVSAGSLHTCAITTKDDIFCWGARKDGALGIPMANGNITNPNTRINVVENGEVVKFKSVSAGGTIYNFERDLNDSLLPEGKVVDDADQSIAARNQHTCAISMQGKIYCWGQNNHLQLGNNDSDTIEPPTQPIATPKQITLTAIDENIIFSEVKTGYFHTCAKGVKNDKESIFCWGSFRSGKLGSGNGTVTDQASPVEIQSQDYSNF